MLSPYMRRIASRQERQTHQQSAGRMGPDRLRSTLRAGVASAGVAAVRMVPSCAGRGLAETRLPRPGRGLGRGGLVCANEQRGGEMTETRREAAVSSMHPTEIVEAGIIARRYYIDRRTKMEIADEFGLSRFKVARILDQAVEFGLVTITINAPARIDPELSNRLQTAYGLRHAVVVDTGELPDGDLRQELGQVGASLLTELVSADDVVGLAWGRTLDAVTASLTSLPQCTVVQITGVAGSPENNSNELVRRLAAVSGGPVHQFFVPLVVPDAHTASALRAQPDVVAAAALFPSITVAMIAIGSWAPPESQLLNAVTEGDRLELEQLGVAAEICAVFLDGHGQPVHSQVEQRCISISADHLKQIPELIAVAGGPKKIGAIEAVLKGGFATTLVTDSVAARGLLERNRVPEPERDGEAEPGADQDAETRPKSLG